jgi:hypothetical protein
VEMLNIVLKNNVIEFNGEFFLQLQGTAMGTKNNIDRENINIIMEKIYRRYICHMARLPWTINVHNTN